MSEETMSEHCSLLAKPGGPPKPAVRPADCPKDAAYINATKQPGGTFNLPGNTDFPIVFEGGKGDDRVEVVGSNPKILVKGGEGNDSLTVQAMPAYIIGRFSAPQLLGLAAILMLLALIAFIALRALRIPTAGEDRA